MGTGSIYFGRRLGLAGKAIICILGLTGASLALAQKVVPAIKPGLWEVTSAFHAAPVDRSKLSPQELERLDAGKAQREERLKQMQQPRPVCISGEMVSKGHWFGGGRAAADCQFGKVVTTAKTISYETTCSGARASKGKGKLTMLSADKFSGETRSQSEASGREIKITSQGVWKSADCGAVAPNYPNVK